MENILKNDIDRHTFFQLSFFVIGKEPTHQAKLKKCVDELKCRKRAIDSMMLEIDDLNDKNELLSVEINAMDEVRKRMTNRRIVLNKRSIEDILSKIKGQKEEAAFFVKTFEKLNGIEKIKSWDDPDVQLEYWNAKYMEEINYRILVGLPIEMDMLKSILAMPDTNVKKKVLSLLVNKKTIEEKNG